MEVVIDPAILPAMQGKITEAVQVLKSVVGKSADLLKVEWNQGQDERGRSLLILRLTDCGGATAEGQFAPDELGQTIHLRDRLHWLWGDLLQDRSQKQLEKLRETVKQLGDE